MSGLLRSFLPALRLWADRRGNFAIYTAVALIPIAFAVAASVDYVFNGSSGEKLEGIVYLPNRGVTYNSTTNIGATKFSLVVNLLIVNSANWSFSGLSGGGGDMEAIYLSR